MVVTIRFQQNDSKRKINLVMMMIELDLDFYHENQLIQISFIPKLSFSPKSQDCFRNSEDWEHRLSVIHLREKLNFEIKIHF